MKMIKEKETAPKTIEAFACPCNAVPCGCECASSCQPYTIQAAVSNGIADRLMSAYGYGTQTAFY